DRPAHGPARPRARDARRGGLAEGVRRLGADRRDGAADRGRPARPAPGDPPPAAHDPAPLRLAPALGPPRAGARAEPAGGRAEDDPPAPGPPQRRHRAGRPGPRRVAGPLPRAPPRGRGPGGDAGGTPRVPVPDRRTDRAGALTRPIRRRNLWPEPLFLPRTDEGTMLRDRRTFGAAALIAGLFCATPTWADAP